MKTSMKFRQWLETRHIRPTGYVNEVLTAIKEMESTLGRIANGDYTNPNIAAQELLERLVSDQQEIAPERFSAAQQAVRIVGHLDERFRSFSSDADRRDARQFIESILLGKVDLS